MAGPGDKVAGPGESTPEPSGNSAGRGAKAAQPGPEGAPDPADGARAARGAALTVASGAARLVFTLLTAAVLARILTPEAFGVMGLATPFLVIATAFADGGAGGRTLRLRAMSRGEEAAALRLSLIAGAALSALLLLAAPALTAIYGDARAGELARILAIVPPLAALRMHLDAVAKRRLDHADCARAEIVAAAASSAAGIGAALAGAGFWALAAIPVARHAVHGAMMWRAAPPAIRGGTARGGDLLAAAARISGARLIWEIARGADRVALGALAGAAALGPYVLAHALMTLPALQVLTPAAGAALPHLARAKEEPARFARALAWIEEACALAIWPALAAAAALSGPLLAAMLGPGWDEAARIFPWLALAAAAEAARQPSGWAVAAQAREGLEAAWALRAGPILAGGAMLGAWSGGAEGAAMALGAVSLLLAVGQRRFLAMRSGRALPDLAAFARPALIAGASGLGALAGAAIAGGEGLGALGLGGVGAGAAALLAAWAAFGADGARGAGRMAHTALRPGRVRAVAPHPRAPGVLHDIDPALRVLRKF